MYACRSKFINKVNWINDINQLMEIAKIAAVVIKRPTDAVTVNSEKFIFRTIYKNINYLFRLKLYQKIRLQRILFVLFQKLIEKKKGLTFVRPSDGEPYF